jgi:hypothetical protein
MHGIADVRLLKVFHSHFVVVRHRSPPSLGSGGLVESIEVRLKGGVMSTQGKLKRRVATGIAVAVVLGAAQPVLAQESGGQGLEAACKEDYQSFCSGDNPGVAMEAACLRQYYINLSMPCRAALDQQQNPAAAGEDQSGSSDQTDQ